MNSPLIPATFQEFRQIVGEGHRGESGTLYDIADAFGSLIRCNGCGKPIIQADALAQAAARQYALNDIAAMSVEGEVNESGLEVGDVDNPHLCRYHGDLARKDD